MSLSRRHFVEGLISAGALTSLLETAHASQTKAILNKTQPVDAIGNSFGFWSNYYNPAKRSANPGADEDRRVSYLHYNAPEGRLRFAHQIQPKELYAEPGDVAVAMSVIGMRLSQADREKFKRIQSAQLRLDLVQDNKMFDIIDRLAWASVAGLYVSQGKMPPLQDLSFASEANQNMLLPGGSGLLGVNVSMAHRESRLYQLLQLIVKEVGRFAPVVGLPAISLTALNEFNRFYGALEHRTTFLFQTTAPQRVFATQPARQQAETTAGINLVNGDYILVPQEYEKEFEPHLSDFQLVGGYLVPKGTEKQNRSVSALADDINPDISYIGVNIKVSPPWQMRPRSAPVGDSSRAKAQSL